MQNIGFLIEFCPILSSFMVLAKTNCGHCSYTVKLFSCYLVLFIVFDEKGVSSTCSC